MLLLVEVDDTFFIADAGFGGLTLTAPLLLKPDIEQKTPHEYFRLIKNGEDFVLEANVRQIWKALYTFGMQENFLPDCEVTSWYLSNHPNSHFVTGLIAGLPFPDGRYALRNNEFTTHYLNGTTERKRLLSAFDLKMILEKTFRIDLPNVVSMDTVLRSITNASSTK